MEKPEDRKARWERPIIRFVGALSLLVRGGSAQGKQQGDKDGDANQFLGFGQTS